MRTDAERLSELYWAAQTARIRVLKAGDLLAAKGVDAGDHLAALARALQQIPTVDDKIGHVKVCCRAMAELARRLDVVIDENDVDELRLYNELRGARRRLAKAGDAFLVDTQPI